MSGECGVDQAVLSPLVGRWEGTLRHRAAPDQPFEEFPGRSENRWVLGGRFVEMTLKGGLSGDGPSALFYIGHERDERRYVLVSLEPGNRQVTIRQGEWWPDPGCLILISHAQPGGGQANSMRVVCDCRTAGELKLELREQPASGEEYLRFRAEYRTAEVARVPPVPRPLRRRVIA